MRSNTPTAALVLSLLPLLAACGPDKPSPSPEPPQVNLPVAVATWATVFDGAMASGTVEADDRVELVARMSGTVQAPDLYEGQPVKRGQVLATIDTREADAAIARSRAGLDAALAEQRDADGDVKRDRPLAQSGALSRDTYRKEQLRSIAAAAGVEQARAALNAAEAGRSYVVVASPIDGVIVSPPVRDGAMAMAGTPLATVEGREHLLFRFAVPQASLDAFAPGGDVTVLLDGRENQPITGRVRAAVPSADPATRRYTVEVSLPRDDAIMPGMFGRVRLPADGPNGGKRVVSVPAAAVTERGDLTGVFVVGKDQHLYFRWIRLGGRIGDRIAVTVGLSPGERILARIDPSVRDGARLAGGGVK